MAKICPICKGKGINKIPYYEFEPRRFCQCGRCLGTGKVEEADSESYASSLPNIDSIYKD